MKTIVAADIHGITPELKVLFVPLGPDVLFASPWGDGGRPCSSEAVAHFLKQQGLQTYASRLAQMAGEEPTFFVGLSVGGQQRVATCSYGGLPCAERSGVVLRLAHSGLGASAPVLPHHAGIC